MEDRKDWMTCRITPAMYEMGQAIKACCRRRDFDFELREDPQEPWWEISFCYKSLSIFWEVLQAMVTLGYDERLIQTFYFSILESAHQIYGEEKIAEVF